MITLIFWIAFILAVIVFVFIKSKSYSKYKNVSLFMLAVTGILLWSSYIISVENLKSRKEDSSTAIADGFTIDYYNVILDVDSKQNVKVKEDIGIDFYEAGHHGIYRTIPEWLPYTNKENNTVSRRAVISNINVENDFFSLSSESSRTKIKIGNPNVTLNEGVHPYSLSYNYNLGPDEFSGYDEFIFHAYGNYWGTEINNANVEIHLPHEFDGTVRFYSDKYRKNEITDYIDFRIDDNIIYASVSDNYHLTSALTIDVLLPDGYFENAPANNYGYGSLICCIACLFIAACIILLWMFKGKDLKATDVSDSYTIPDNLDAAAIGYVYKKNTGIKLAIATILQLAVKGYIIITDKDNKTVISRNISEKGINDLINRQVEFKLLKSYSELKKDKDIRTFFNFYIETDKELYTVSDDIDKFYKDAEALIKDKYIEIVKDTIEDYSPEDLEKIEKKAEAEKSQLLELTDSEKIVYDGLFVDGASTCELSKRHDFYLTIDELNWNLNEKYFELIHDISSYKFMLLSSIVTFFSCILYLIGYWFIEDLNPSMSYMYYVAVAGIVVSMFFTLFMGKKTSYGENLFVRIDNFKNNIKNVDVDRFKTLVNNYDDYAYKLIPYAYVLDLSYTWKEKFKDLPVYKNSNNDYYLWNDRNYNHLYNDVTSSTTTSSDSSSGGCSSCGGGCSSCGGGGSW